jgi:NAD(P)-dependent dehydrogenase (short-subunit alcohol dehydrogenase family)
MDPKGRVALLTGTARIGETVALALAQRGCDLALVYRGSQKAADAVAAAARRAGVRALTVQADLSQPAEAARVVAEVRRDLGRLDILIPMASVYEKTAMDAMDDAAFHRTFDVDFESFRRLAFAAAPGMRAEGGRIVGFADWLPASGRPRYKGMLPYYVAKGGIVALVEGLALELAPEVLVNAVAPGPILKPAEFSDAEDREVMRATPLQRWGGAIEIARTVLFLIETEFITGETVRVDGGRHLN